LKRDTGGKEYSVKRGVTEGRTGCFKTKRMDAKPTRSEVRSISLVKTPSSRVLNEEIDGGKEKPRLLLVGKYKEPQEVCGERRRGEPPLEASVSGVIGAVRAASARSHKGAAMR